MLNGLFLVCMQSTICIIYTVLEAVHSCAESALSHIAYTTIHVLKFMLALCYACTPPFYAYCRCSRKVSKISFNGCNNLHLHNFAVLAIFVSSVLGLAC